ncbi:hypothetical protein L226DRAFT_603900 [Lentinus tigrinus ALCF2SS1-7]|uniref:Glucose receptor Git3 N-terminal domain-containing protein n=1 Tax=Lentinus tigrinus ALCF2SS1-6 TaxID=1328759 RepID=A0A5C2SL45_9APHY|nr:hypothetical protein L227DRAFT_495458 [Lentinus tigrinus ALCF2SS1-6]RPD76571.1 hypothetical protein L226DRAFT_603900 [Lentinus tigrinus ALCF2SS1-7]
MDSVNYANVVNSDDVFAGLPDGDGFLLRRPYTPGESRGVMILSIISCISATAVAGLLLAIAISAWNTRKSTSSKLFVRSHVAAYFISMLLCEVAQTVGSIMSIRWVSQSAVSYEPYCTVQGVVKHISDVGNAYWYVIAMNTFWILFLRWPLKRYILVLAILTGWCAIGAIISAGPAALQRVPTGPFYAISGYWCWISDEYASERITLDYMIMFLSALFCFIMYTLIFLRLRGNILMHGGHITFRLRQDTSALAPKSVDTHVINIAKGMLLYPVAYTILLLPIAVCRFAEWTGHTVPFSVTIASDAVFLLSGFVNVVLFLTTRRVLPMYSVIPRSVYRLFGSSAMSVSLRASTGTYTTTSSFSVDIEKSMSPYNGGMISGDGPISAAPTRYTATSPIFTLGSANSETYDKLALSSAEARRRSFTYEVDISSIPYAGDYYASGAQSPTTSMPIRSGEVSPVGISPVNDAPSQLRMPRPLHGAGR